MKLLIETERADLRFNEETNAIELIWKKLHDEATYKTLFTKGVVHLEEHKATGWLSDIRKEGVVGPATSKWLQTEIIPKAVSLGLKRIAIVMDADVFKKFYVSNIEKGIGNKEHNMIKYFDSLDAANDWLKEKTKAV